MAEWIRNGHECSECGFRLLRSAKCYEWIERGDHGYLYKNYAVTPAECPKCHNEMTAVVYEGGTGGLTMTDTSYHTKRKNEEKYLGKIDFAEFGLYPDRPFLYGLMLGFSFPGKDVTDGGKYTVNISDGCGLDGGARQFEITKKAKHLMDILKDAKCNYVSELKGKPVEVTIVDGTFKDFRILTEVL